MRSLPTIYWVQFKIGLINQFQYRVATLVWLISWAIEPVIYLTVWSTVAHTTGGRVGEFAPADFAAYFIALMLVNHFTYTWVIWEYEFHIRNGTLSIFLLRPIHPIHKDIAENLANKVLTLVIFIPLVLLLGVTFRPVFHLTFWTTGLFIPALLLAYFIRFLIEWTLALTAFWLIRMSALSQLYFATFLFCSGQLAPLSLLPQPLQLLATFLPFRWVIAFPVELLLGHLTGEDILAGFVAQGIWLLLGFGSLTLVWRLGIQRYSAVNA
jgi:ABC-2 type transport system permease protein